MNVIDQIEIRNIRQLLDEADTRIGNGKIIEAREKLEKTQELLHDFMLEFS